MLLSYLWANKLGATKMAYKTTALLLNDRECVADKQAGAVSDTHYQIDGLYDGGGKTCRTPFQSGHPDRWPARKTP